jgi:signal transduction histidine kinase
LLVAAEPVSESAWTLVDLADVASAGAAAVAFEAAQADVEVALDLVPSGAGLVRGGRPALERTAVALLDNAIRHTPPSGTVTVSTTTEQRWVTLRVTDTGQGIPEAALPHLFARFAHGEGAHGPRRRFGLGLALVADTAERLGGEVDVQTGPGGTCFTVRLPRAESTEPDGL